MGKLPNLTLFQAVLAHYKKRNIIFYSSLYNTDCLKAALQTSEQAQCGSNKKKWWC